MKQDVTMGDTMYSFNHRLPDLNRDILYLLGNGISGTASCQMVVGRFNPNFGDFSRDKKGNFEYVTYWKYR